MKILKWIGIAFGALVLLGIVVTLSSPEGREGFDRGADAARGSEEPDPTPLVIMVTPEPQEQPTPRVETVTETIETEVEVVPEVCKDALRLADRLISDYSGEILDILEAYVDYPDENLGEFGARVEVILNDRAEVYTPDDWDEYTALADECLAS